MKTLILAFVALVLISSCSSTKPGKNCSWYNSKGQYFNHQGCGSSVVKFLTK